MSDTLELLQRAKSGSSAAFTVLFQRHRARLTAMVAARMSPRLRAYGDAEDVVQEAYLEAARKFETFEPEVPQAFYRWLARIAGFKLREAERHGRARKRGDPERLHGEPAADQTSVAGRVGRDERTQRIVRGLGHLPAAQAEAVRLRYLQGLSVAETAERIERSEAAVKALVGRGLRALAQHVRPGSSEA